MMTDCLLINASSELEHRGVGMMADCLLVNANLSTVAME